MKSCFTPQLDRGEFIMRYIFRLRFDFKVDGADGDSEWCGN